jgi:hypothetical protein
VEDEEGTQGVLDDVATELLGKNNGFLVLVEEFVVVVVANGAVKSLVGVLEKFLHFLEVFVELGVDFPDLEVEDALGKELAVGNPLGDGLADGAGEVLDLDEPVDEGFVDLGVPVVAVVDSLLLLAVDPVGINDFLVDRLATGLGDRGTHADHLGNWVLVAVERVRLEQIPEAGLRGAGEAGGDDQDQAEEWQEGAPRLVRQGGLTLHFEIINPLF